MTDADHVQAAAAVLVHSEVMPEDAVKVVGIDFNTLKEKRSAGPGLLLDDVLAAYSTTGFQGSSLGKAIDVIDEMVCAVCSPCSFRHPGDQI